MKITCNVLFVSFNYHHYLWCLTTSKTQDFSTVFQKMALHLWIQNKCTAPSTNGVCTRFLACYGLSLHLWVKNKYTSLGVNSVCPRFFHLVQTPMPSLNILTLSFMEHKRGVFSHFIRHTDKGISSMCYYHIITIQHILF